MQEMIRSVFSRVDKSNLNPSVVRQLSGSFARDASPRVSIAGLKNDFVRHLVENRAHQHSLNLLNTLHLSFVTDHALHRAVEEGPTFLAVCNSCILRDLDTLQGLAVLRACVALARYHALSK